MVEVEEEAVMSSVATTEDEKEEDGDMLLVTASEISMDGWRLRLLELLVLQRRSRETCTSPKLEQTATEAVTREVVVVVVPLPF